MATKATIEDVQSYIGALEFDLHLLDNEALLAITSEEEMRVGLIREQTEKDLKGARRKLQVLEFKAKFRPLNRKK